MKNDLVSILVPTYNQEKMIPRCIESVLNQTYNTWELIIIDDASRDSTPDIVWRYAKVEKRIKLISNSENNGMHGLYKNYNKALEVATGEYIAILEGDDFWHPEKLERQVAELKSNKLAVLCYSNIEVINNNNKKLGSSRLHWKNSKSILNNDPVGIKYFHFLTLENRVPSITILVRRNVLEEIGGFQKIDKIGTTDYPTLFYLIGKGPFCFIKKPLAFYVIHGGNYSLNKMKQFQRGFIELTNKNKNEFKEKWAALGVNVDRLSLVQQKILNKKILIDECKKKFHDKNILHRFNAYFQYLKLRAGLQINKYSLLKKPYRYIRL